MDRECSMPPEVIERLRAGAKAEAELKALAELERRAGQVILPADILKPNLNGYGLPYRSIPVGVTWPVRFVGNLVAFLMHFERDRSAHLCLGADCPRCKAGESRWPYAAADAITKPTDPKTGIPFLQRSIERFSASAMRELYYAHGLGVMIETTAAGIEIREGGNLRGYGVEFFRRGVRSATRVEIRSSTCSHALPEPCNVKAVLMRIHFVTSWPVYQTAADVPGDGPAIRCARAL